MAVKAAHPTAKTSRKRHTGVVSAFVIETPSLALVARVRNVAEFAQQCVDDYWEHRIEAPQLLNDLGRCSSELASIKTGQNLGSIGETQRYFLELEEEVAALVAICSGGPSGLASIEPQRFLKHYVRIQYLANALLSELRLGS